MDTPFDFIETDHNESLDPDMFISGEIKMSDYIYNNIAHGDDDHRKWLKDSLESLMAALPKNVTIDATKPEFTGQFTIGTLSPGIYVDTFDSSKYSQPHDASTSIGIKYDKGKPRPSLLPLQAVMEVVKVLEFGAKKYGENNWQQVVPASRYYDAALRHIFAWKSGEQFDTETGLSHFAHAATCLLFLLHFHLTGTSI